MHRLETAAKLAEGILSDRKPGELLEPNVFASGPDPVPGAAAKGVRRQVLRALGIVETTVGRGGPATVRDGAQDRSKRILEAARGVWTELASGDGRVAEERLLAATTAAGLVDSDVEAVKSLLKALEVAVGVQRVGGLQRVDIAESDVQKAVKAAVAEEAAKPEDLATMKGEQQYYDLLADVVSQWEGDYEATVLGGRQIGEGEWSTPDVIGVSVQRAPSLVIPIVRIVTVEVKLRFSRLGIAEATAHRRFAHYSYVAVPEALTEIDGTLITELAQAGLGLICPLQRNSLTFHVAVDAALNRPDEENAEQLLGRFKTDAGEPICDRVRARVRQAMAVLLA